MNQQYLSKLKAVNGIQIEALPLYKTVPNGIKMEIPILFRILIGDHSHIIKRQPIHLCAILDRSGSMIGSPLLNCKKAIKHLVSQLSPNDRLSLVIYDDEPEVVFEAKATKEISLNLIDEIHDRGSTNISGALELATKILKKEPESTYQRVAFLFSDGEANRGVMNLDSLGTMMLPWVTEDHIRFSSYGIGDNYNESFMKSVARGGEGNYFFIDNVETMTNVVEKGLNGFLQIIGQKANFRVRGLNGQHLTTFQNSKNTETLVNGKTLPSLRSLGMYQFMTTIEVSSETNGQIPVMEYHLTFEPVEGLPYDRHQTGAVLLQFVDQCKLEKNPEVLCYQMIQNCGDLNLEVEKAMNANQPIKAIEHKKAIIAKYESVFNLDQLGVIGALLKKEKETLKVLQEEGLSKRSEKLQNYSAAFCFRSNSMASNAAPSQQISTWEQEKESFEEDNDVGFTLFD